MFVGLETKKKFYFELRRLWFFDWDWIDEVEEPVDEIVFDDGIELDGECSDENEWWPVKCCDEVLKLKKKY